MTIDTTSAGAESDTAAPAPVRRHDIPGVYNLRDVGGYRAAGGTTRWGKLFRSDALHRLDDAGRARFAELGITDVVDLRGVGERTTSPNAIDGLDVRVHHLPVFDEAAPAAQAETAPTLVAVYDVMIDQRGRQLAEAVRLIADSADDEAVLVHCMAGKDRTGLVVALALRAVGVHLDEVVADYAQTADNLSGEWADAMLAAFAANGADVTPEVRELVTASPAPVLSALLARIEVEHGSVRGYLRAQGMTDDELDRLTAALID